MIQVNAMGDTCPIPVVKAKNAIRELNGSGIVEVFVDNDIAVQNLTKMANQKGYGVKSEKLEERKFKVIMEIAAAGRQATDSGNIEKIGQVSVSGNIEKAGQEAVGMEPADIKAAGIGETCMPDARRNTVVVISSDKMGEGDEELGKILMKGFLYALAGGDELPAAMLFYNGGAAFTCEESPVLDDLKSLEAQGVEILTCGTCLNHYGLTDKLKVGEVTNMYVIAEKMTKADRIVKP